MTSIPSQPKFGGLYVTSRVYGFNSPETEEMLNDELHDRVSPDAEAKVFATINRAGLISRGSSGFAVINVPDQCDDKYERTAPFQNSKRVANAQ